MNTEDVVFFCILGQVKHQGLNENINLDSVDGVPMASTDRWSELTEAERLQENLRAYLPSTLCWPGC